MNLKLFRLTREVLRETSRGKDLEVVERIEILYYFAKDGASAVEMASAIHKDWLYAVVDEYTIAEGKVDLLN